MPNLTFNYDSLLFTGYLTDRKIAHYQREGRYGPDEQKKLLARDEERSKIQKARKDQVSQRKQVLRMYD